MLTAIHETELAMHRLRSTLKLLKTPPPKETLDIFYMSEGAWIDYHIATWSFYIYGLLERERKLVCQVCRSLIKPNNPHYEDIEKELLKSVKAQKDKVEKLRHPEAHVGEGGVIEKVMKNGSWKDYLILPSPIDFNHVLASYEAYHMRWYESLYQFSLLQIARMEQISQELYKCIDWKRI